MRNASSFRPMLARGAGCLFASCVVLTLPSAHGESWQDIFGSPPEPGDWSRHFRAGALVGFNLKAEFSMSGTFNVASGNPGTAGGEQNHDYDDGYVRLDATGNDLDLTWNWGYESAGQLQNGLLSFHSLQSYTATASGSADSDAQVGFDTAYGGRLTRMWGGTLGWEFGFGFLPVEITDTLSSPANVTRLVHTFDTGGILLPQAPYQGSFNGPGATISDVAVQSFQALSGVPLTSSQTLDVKLYNFRLGPTLQWELHPRVAVVVSAGAAFGIVTGDLEYNDTLLFAADGTTASNQGQIGDTQFVYGGYIGGTLLYHAVKNGDFYLGFQYMPMSSATFSGDGREAKLDLTGGLYISAGINWPF